jgi:hypothetical protein
MEKLLLGKGRHYSLWTKKSMNKILLLSLFRLHYLLFTPSYKESRYEMRANQIFFNFD